MSHGGCETQSGDVSVFDVSVHTGYRPLYLQRPQTPELCHGEESVNTWPQKSSIWGHPYVLLSGWLFVSCFVYDVVLTADLLFYFFNGRATIDLTWELFCACQSVNWNNYY